MGWVGCIFALAMSNASWYDRLLSSVTAAGEKGKVRLLVIVKTLDYSAGSKACTAHVTHHTSRRRKGEWGRCTGERWVGVGWRRHPKR